MKIQAKISDLKAGFNQTSITLKTDAEAAELEKLKDKELDVELKVHREKRSLDANACLWACLSELAGVLGTTKWDMYLRELKDYGGKFVTVRVLKNVLPELQQLYRAIEVTGDEIVQVEEPVINPDTGEQVLDDVTLEPLYKQRKKHYYLVNCYIGSHEYNTKEFSILLNGVIEDMKAVGLTPPPSREMKQMLDEMERKENQNV